MSVTSMLSPYILSAPALLLGGGYLFSRLTGFSLWVVLLTGTLPFGLLMLDLPFSEMIVQQEPFVLVLAGWCALIALGIGRWFVFKLFSVLDTVGGMARVVVMGGMGLSAIVVTLLYVQPVLLEEYVPGWKSAAGVLLFSCCLLGSAVTCMRFVRESAVLVFWLFVTVVLGSEVFLDRLPNELLARELQGTHQLVPVSVLADEVAEAKRTLKHAGAEATGGVLVLGGTHAAGAEGALGDLLAANLSSVFGPTTKPTVHTVSAPYLGVEQLRSILGETIDVVKPSIVILNSWFDDARENWNSYGVHGLTEAQAAAESSRLATLESIPFFRRIVESRLYNAFVHMVGNGEAHADLNYTGWVRTTAEEYEERVRSIVGTAQAGGAVPVLVYEPTEEWALTRGAPYKEVLERIAREGKLPFIDGSLIVSEGQQETLFIRDQVLSQKGASAISALIARQLRSIATNYPQLSALVGDVTGGQLSTGPVSFVVSRQQASRDLPFVLQVPRAGKSYFKVIFSVNGMFVDDKRLNGSEPLVVRFHVPAGAASLPASMVSVHTIAAPGDEDDRIGTTDFLAPLPVTMEVNSVSRTATLSVQGVSPVRSEFREGGFGVTVLDHRSGMPLETRIFSLDEEGQGAMGKFIKSVAWGSVIAIGGYTPDGFVANALLVSGLRYVGLQLGDSTGAFAALGVTGSKAHAGMLVRSDTVARLSRGGPRSKRLSEFSATLELPDGTL